MPDHVDKPNEAVNLRQLAVRVFNIERTLRRKQTDGLIGREVSIVFALSNLAVGTSAPFPPPWRLQLTRMYARLRVASSSGPVTAELLVNDGGPHGSISIAAGAKVAEDTINPVVGPEDWVTARSVLLGTGAEGLTVRVDGYVIGRT